MAASLGEAALWGRLEQEPLEIIFPLPAWAWGTLQVLGNSQ